MTTPTEAGDARSLDELMAAYCAGDDRGFDALYEGVSGRLVEYLRRRGLRDQARIDDVVQQTFLHLHRTRGHFIPGAEVLPWAFRIARNAMIDLGRKGRREQSQDPSDEANVHFARLAATTPSGEDIVRAAELKQHIQTVYASVPGPQRAAFDLVKDQGLSASQAAAHLDTTVVGVRLRLHRFYEALRAVLRDGDEQ